MKPAPLFLDPLVAGNPTLAEQVQRMLRRLEAGAVVDVPSIPNLSSAQFTRWLYRQWLGGGQHWGPLVQVDPSRFGAEPDVLAEAMQLAEGGWLCLDRGWERLHLPRSRNYLLLRQSDVTLELPPTVAERIRWLDRFHIIAADPALEGLRRSLLSHCRAGSPIHLSGPRGAGRKSLVRWAHAALDDRRLVEMRRGDGRRPSPSEWLLCGDAGELEADQLSWLYDRVNPHRRPPPPPSPLPRSTGRPRHPAFAPILGSSPALSSVLSRAERVAPTTLPVLILGESGTGKESLARAIHEASGRKGAYVVVDLAAMNENIVESELFGHVRGAFTGADRDRQGAFRAADRGTLFLDEFGNVPPKVQAKLLRALQEHLVQPVGDDRSFRVDVRILAATNADLEDLVQRGHFREDLVRRVEAVTLRLPPLRERTEDMFSLAQIFLTRERQGRSVPTIGSAAERLLRDHDWPGNIRELSNVMAHAAAFADEVVEPEHLGALAPSSRRPAPTVVIAAEAEPDPRLPDRLRAVRLAVPSLTERGITSVRAAILAMLDGRPIRADALAILESRPWPDNLTGMEADFSAIRANIEGTVDLAGLSRALPYLLAPTQHPKDAERPKAPAGIWKLAPEEIQALNDLVLSFQEGNFGAHLEAGLADAAPPLDRLAAYILGPRPTQYCTRLYEHPLNRALCEDLRQRVAFGGAVVTELPAGIRRVVDPTQQGSAA